jgi:hypothetical protein
MKCIFAFYSSSGDRLGVSSGKWESDYRGCDYLANPGGDAVVAAAVASRFSCTGFPCVSIAGVGAGVGIGGTAASDRNAYMSPYGDVMPQDFDDTGWTGDAIGTLHHALYTIIPSGYIANAVWPTPNEGGTNRTLKNGQIIQLDPYACSATQFDLSCFAVNDQRIAKTLMGQSSLISEVTGQNFLVSLAEKTPMEFSTLPIHGLLQEHPGCRRPHTLKSAISQIMVQEM